LNRVFGDIWTYSNEYNYVPTITQVWYTYKGRYDFETFGELMQNLQESSDRKQKQLGVYNTHKRKWNLILTKSVKESEALNELIPESILLN
jgi:hypothetical protein